MGSVAAHYDAVRLGSAPADGLKRQKATLAVILATPGGKVFWERFAEQYPDPFRRYVEKEVLGREGAA